MWTPFPPATLVSFRGTQWRVGRVVGQQQQLESPLNGEIQAYDIEVLLEEFVAGTLFPLELANNKARHRSPGMLTTLVQDAASHDTRLRVRYLGLLTERGAFEMPAKDFRSALRDVAKELNESRPPHPATVARWRRKLRLAEGDIRALRHLYDQRGGRGKSRLHRDVEAAVEEEVSQLLATQHVWSARDVLDRVKTRIQDLNRNRPAARQLQLPSLRTLQRRLEELPAFDVAVARHGFKEAERRFAFVGASRNVTRILEIVEIDHSPLDILIVDAKGRVIARPTITVILDRKSRMVLGFHVSAAGHGTAAVLAALEHALLPKTYLKQRYADLRLVWPAFGWPERVLMDNGSEFHARTVEDVLLQLAIHFEFAASRTPNDKAFVERFLRTLNYGFVHKLPGTTMAKVHERKGIDPEAEARLTLEELDRLLHVWICDEYHKRPHAGLHGRTPEAVWLEGATQHPPQLKMLPEQLRIELAEYDKRSLHHYGIDLNNFRYASPELADLHRKLPRNSKVEVKWRKADVGFIWVWNSLDERYISVPNTEEEFIGLTLEQAQAVVETRRAEGQAAQVTTHAHAKRDAIIQEAQSSQKLSRRKAGTRLANTTSRPSRHGPISPGDPVLIASGPSPSVCPSGGDEAPFDMVTEDAR